MLRSVPRVCLALSLLLVLAGGAAADPASAVAAQDPWTLAVGDDDAGYAVYRRLPADSKFAAFRLEAELEATPAELARAARAVMLAPSENVRKELLREDGDVFVFYSYIDMPMFLSDLDIATRAEQHRDAATGARRIAWRTTDEGPPRKEGVARIERSVGVWIFEPEGDGRTRLTYESHTEPPVPIPAWIVNSMTTESVVEQFQGLQTRLDLQRASGG
jgi:hypothetical protein